MTKRVVLWCLLLLFKSPICSHAQENIHLVAPDFKPYSFKEDGKIQGIGVDFVKKIMKEIGAPYTLSLFPNYGRAVQETRVGRADGFFLASENEERNAIAIFSDPVMSNRWCWFLPAESKLDPKSDSFKETARIGTHLHTNTHKWLQKNGFRVTVTPLKVDVLIKLIEKKRVDAVFLAESVFVNAAQQTGFFSDNYKQVVQVEHPFGIYISKEYVSRNTCFMQKLNKAIKKTRK